MLCGTGKTSQTLQGRQQFTIFGLEVTACDIAGCAVEVIRLVPVETEQGTYRIRKAKTLHLSLNRWNSQANDVEASYHLLNSCEHIWRGHSLDILPLSKSTAAWVHVLNIRRKTITDGKLRTFILSVGLGGGVEQVKTLCFPLSDVYVLSYWRWPLSLHPWDP